MKKNLRGGKAEKLGWRPEQYDQRQLKIGTKHELEHTDDPTIARGIAMDHLAEQVLDGKTQDYYDRLAQLEPNRSKEELFRDWERLVNLSAEELESFLETPEGSVAGLSREEARRQGIGSGQESAQWIIRMKRTSPHDWTWKMWDWAQRQVNFIQRMSAMRGPLYDSSGQPTRKLLSLLVWGHAPAEVLAVLRDTAPPTKAHGRRYVANESFDEKYERDQRIKRKTIEAWREEFNDKKILKVPGSDWHTITVTRSTRPGVKFQVTRWDLEDGALVPLGHMDITTSLDSALDELWWMADRKRYRENARRRLSKAEVERIAEEIESRSTSDGYWATPEWIAAVESRLEMLTSIRDCAEYDVKSPLSSEDVARVRKELDLDRLKKLADSYEDGDYEEESHG